MNGPCSSWSHARLLTCTRPHSFRTQGSQSGTTGFPSRHPNLDVKSRKVFPRPVKGPVSPAHLHAPSAASAETVRTSAQARDELTLDPQLISMQSVIMSCLESYVENNIEEEVPLEFQPEAWSAASRGKGNRLSIECRTFSSPVFARITPTMIAIEGGFQAFLVAFEPRDCFEIPMFGAEVVSRNGRVTVAFADCSPVNEAHSLPVELSDALSGLQQQHGLESMPIRKTPPEFQAVFSDKCVVLMPKGEEVSSFLEYLNGVLEQYLTFAASESARHLQVENGGCDTLPGIKEAQRQYCELGLTNAEKKVVPVLRECADPEMVERFLRWLWLGEDTCYHH